MSHHELHPYPQPILTCNVNGQIKVLASEHDHDDPEIRSIKNQEIEDIFNELEGTGTDS